MVSGMCCACTWLLHKNTLLSVSVLSNILCVILVLFLLCLRDVDPQMAGKWYLIGFATNAQWFTNRRASMKMGTAVFTPTADGDLDMSYASLT